MLRRSQPELLQLIALALWIGAAAFFSIVVAPALFAVLPARSLAGEVVGRLLPTIFYSGMFVGALVVATQIRSRGEWSWRGRESAALVMIAACVIAQVIVVPRIVRLRQEIGGPLEILPMDDVRRVAFGRLHGASVAWLGLAMLAAAAIVVIVVRALHSTDRTIHTL